MIGVEFEHAYILFALLTIPGMYLLYARYNSNKKESVLKFSSLKIIQESVAKKSLMRKHLPFVLLMSVLGMAITGMANPQVPVFTTEKGINLSIVLDGSESMSASDYEPTRLDAAKDAVSGLVSRAGSGISTGVVLFESGATTISYMTPDKEKTMSRISSIEQGRGATAIGDGLVLGIDMVSSVPDRRNMIILLSDGVQNSGFATPEEAIEYAKANGVQIHTIGLGSKEPVFLRNDVYGEPQYAELDEVLLKKIAEQTNGRYFRSLDGETLNDVFLELSGSLEYKAEYSSIRDWFFAAAIGLLLANAYVIYGKYRIVA